MEKFLAKLSPKAAKWVKSNANKLANFLESLENWAAYPIIVFLTRNGVPVDVATEIAHVILFFVG